MLRLGLGLGLNLIVDKLDEIDKFTLKVIAAHNFFVVDKNDQKRCGLF